jgi:uncharacterized damage-inducible protein DinB
MTWTAPEIERTEDPDLGDERTVLAGWLDYHRDTLLWKCAGLDEAQLKTASVEPSNLTLLGLIRHMTEIERWFRSLFTGEVGSFPYAVEDNLEAAINDVEGADAQADYSLLVNEIELTRKAAGLRSLDDTEQEEGEGKRNLRTAHLHIIEEYARHNGHADLIRERIDGVTGV